MRAFFKAAAVAALFAVTGAQAADLTAPAASGYKDGAYVADTWWNAGDVFVRIRGEAVIPQTSTNNWSSNAVALHPNFDITTSGIAELDLSYFFTKNIAVELVCCVSPHTLNGRDGLAGLGKIGDTWLFPPTLLLQYHFDTFGAFKPYVGAGVNYTVFFDESTGPNYRNLHIDNTWGAAVQVGFDYHLQGNWFLNFDFKKLWLQPDFGVNVVPLGGARVTGRVDIDPIFVGAGIGYRFGTAYIPLK